MAWAPIPELVCEATLVTPVPLLGHQEIDLRLKQPAARAVRRRAVYRVFRAKFFTGTYVEGSCF